LLKKHKHLRKIKKTIEIDTITVHMLLYIAALELEES